ncbi:MAG: SMP-30/gluconolactonase/LRE family protein, partial [Bryobacteraceae bacterium]
MSYDRRSFLMTALGAAALAPAAAQQKVSSVPTPRSWSGDQLVQYPDPDVVALDNRFRRYMVANTVIQRLFTGTLWAEGVAWNGVGRYLVWSDIPNNRQMRWIEEDGRVTVFRTPSGFSNGNTFDYEGRELSCEHGNRRVARYESNGTVTVIADKFQGKRLNSPNDIVVHPDG